MSFTNKTPNYDLPQYVATDKPTYLVDANGAYLAIDTAMKANETAAATAQSTADTNTAAIGTLNTQINGENGLAADLTAVETLAATTAGSVNTINSLIGNGEPTTTDKTLIGAINELNSGKANAGTLLSYIGNKTFSVTADGVKTLSALMDEVYADYSSYVSAKTLGYLHRPVSLAAQSIGTSNAVEVVAYGNAPYTAIAFNTVVVLDPNVTLEYVVLTNSGSLYNRSVNGTITKHGDAVIADGYKITFTIQEFNVV